MPDFPGRSNGPRARLVVCALLTLVVAAAGALAQNAMRNSASATGIRRLTRIDSADDSIHLRATDDELFNHPWLFAQQVGRWYLSDEEAAALREYLMRGGFPDRQIVDLPEDDEILHVLYDLDERTQIPGRRHLYRGSGGDIGQRAPVGRAVALRSAGFWSKSGRQRIHHCA